MAQSFRQLLGMPPSTASPSDSALVIIDAQNEYAEGKLAVSNAPETRKVISSLLEKYRKANGKIVHVVHIVPEGAPVFTPKTKLAEEYEELKPKDGEKVIEKNHPSSFADTNLHDYLNGIGSKKIVLVGYMVSRGPRALVTRKSKADFLAGARLRLHHRTRWRSPWLRRNYRRGRRWRSRYPWCKWC